MVLALKGTYQVLAHDMAFLGIGLDFGESDKTILGLFHHSKMLPKEFLAGSFVEDYEVWNQVVVFIYSEDRFVMVRDS